MCEGEFNLRSYMRSHERFFAGSRRWPSLKNWQSLYQKGDNAQLVDMVTREIWNYSRAGIWKQFGIRESIGLRVVW